MEPPPISPRRARSCRGQLQITHCITHCNFSARQAPLEIHMPLSDHAYAGQAVDAAVRLVGMGRRWVGLSPDQLNRSMVSKSFYAGLASLGVQKRTAHGFIALI